jgi:hypothetical protein
VASMAFTLNGVVNDTNGLTCTHVDRADSIEKNSGLLFEHK